MLLDMGEPTVEDAIKVVVWPLKPERFLSLEVGYVENLRADPFVGGGDYGKGRVREPVPWRRTGVGVDRDHRAANHET